MNLLWIRHAQSINNAHAQDPTYEHVEDAPLTQLGVTQANHLAGRFRQDMDDTDAQDLLIQAPYLPIYRADALYVSPMRRALQTAAPLTAATGITPHVMPDLYEYGGSYRRVGEPGSYRYLGTTGLTPEKMREIMPNLQVPTEIPITGWWNPDDGFEEDNRYFERGRRVVAFLKTQAQSAWRDKWVVLVSHADFINMVLKMLLMGDIKGHPHAGSFIYPYNTSVTHIQITPDGYTMLHSFSRIDHLPVSMVTH